MKKLLVILLAIMVMTVVPAAMFAESIGPPGDIVAFAAPADYNFTAVVKGHDNGITLAGADLVMRAALDAIAASVLIASVIAAAWTIVKITLSRSRGDDGSIGYHARDQTLMPV